MAPTPLTLPHWFVSTCRGRAGLPAITDELGTSTYAELLGDVERAAMSLRDAGLERARPVCFLLAPSAQYVALVYGCLLAGGVAAPVNTRLSAVEVAAYVERLEPSLVVYDEASAALVPPPERRFGSQTLRFDPARTCGPRTSSATIDHLLAELDEADPAIIFPTGGTSGLPKGAYTSHRGLQLWVWNVASNGRRHQHEVELYMSPFFHVSLVVGCFSPLFAGGHVVIQPAFEPGQSIELIHQHGVTRLMAAPTLYVALATHPTDDERLGIRDITFGSTAAPEAFVNRLLADYPNASVTTGYGATELASGVTRVSDSDLRAGRITGVGRPNVGCEIRIISADGHDVPTGEVGEVIVRSPWQTLGYWNQPEATAETYRGDGFINLGDLGRFDDDGWLHIVGRTKEMIKTGGENVFPVEVESVLVDVDGVVEAVVFGVADEYWGERVEAAVTVRDGAVLDMDEVRARLRDRLAGYKVPKELHVVEAIPLTANNKPDRRVLASRFGPGR